jgi:hypothetical protein
MKLALILTTCLTLGLVELAARGGPPSPGTAPATAPAPGAAAWVLVDSNNREVRNPAEQDIRTAVMALDNEKLDFVFLRADEGHMLQVDWDKKDSLRFTYQDGDEQHQYQSKHAYPAATAVKLLLAYRSGAKDWKKMVDWEPR